MNFLVRCILAFVILFLIVGCGEDEENIIQLLKTDPPNSRELGNLGTLTMTFDGEPTTVTIDSPGGSRTAKIVGKTATYTFTSEDSLVPGGEVPIGISWVSKDGSKGSKIVRLRIIAAGEKSDEGGEVIIGDDGAEMVLIPAGEFLMGDNFNGGSDDNEHPVHTVYLDAFHIDKYEVTNAQYAEFLNSYGQNVDARFWCYRERF